MRSDVIEPASNEPFDAEAEAERLADVEDSYWRLLDHCAKERRDGEVLLEALHMIYDWSDDFSWVDLDELTDLCRVLSKRMETVRKNPAEPPTAEVLDSLVQGANR